MTQYCPHCGSQIYKRLGVMLTKRRAEVFDAIWFASQIHSGGIRSDALEAQFGRAVVKVHVSDLNKRLAKTDWQIVCAREGSAKGFYQFARRRRGNGNVTIPVTSPELSTGENA